jgi:acyl-CoA synthetase (AMP-forming)/AMP-acid ligase II
MPIEGGPLEPPSNPPHLALRVGLETNPDAPALVSAVRSLTWRELDDAAAALAASYRRLGLEPGDRIASLMPNRVDLALHYLACFRAGLVATPLNYRYTSREIDHALEASEASAMLAHAERAADVAASRFADELPCGVITYAGDDAGERSFEALAAGDPRGSSSGRSTSGVRPSSSSRPAAPARPRA